MTDFTGSLLLTVLSVCTPPCTRCPVRQDPSEERFQETARECLAKFNAETKHDHYFALVEVTKATVTTGMLFFVSAMAVEFIIQKTFCPKDPPDITQCPYLPFAALCKGTVSVQLSVKPLRSVSVECDFFPHLPSANVIETPPNQKEAVGQVTDCPWSYFKSPKCPGKVAVKIPGLHLPSRSWEQAETSETKKDM